MLSASPLLYLLFVKGTCGLVGTVSDSGDHNENVVREIYWMDWIGQVPLGHIRDQHPLTTSGGVSAINAGVRTG